MRNPENPYRRGGADNRIRTNDLLITNEPLYQLSYTGIYVSYDRSSHTTTYIILYLAYHVKHSLPLIRAGSSASSRYQSFAASKSQSFATRAKQRAEKPVPPLSFGKVQKMIAPAAGTSSK